MKKSVLLTIGFMFLAVIAGSCSKEDEGNNSKNNPYKSLSLTAKSSEFVQQGEGFALEYIDRINAAAEKDFIVSPLSIQFLMGMLLDGAQGETAEQICSVLGYGAGETDAVNAYCLSLLEQLPGLDKQTTLSIANAIFVNDQHSLLKDYKNNVSAYYQANVANLDFSNESKTLKTINDWCSKQTRGMIPSVLDRVSQDAMAYLLNALYFKSQWKDKFQKGATAEERFTKESGAVSKVMMMKQNRDYSYAENDVLKAVQLPYGNGAFSMLVLLPQDGHTVADVTAELKKTGWAAFRRGLTAYNVNLWLPKFETKYHIQLNDVLSAMGMTDAFDLQKADFKAMSEDALCLSFIQQDAAIKVDEEGTEAAAVSSGAVLAPSSPEPLQRVVFHADHPFLYLITESSTGAILFSGRYSGV